MSEFSLKISDGYNDQEVSLCMYMYMKIHVPSMLHVAIGVDKHTQQTNKQPQWLH